MFRFVASTVVLFGSMMISRAAFPATATANFQVRITIQSQCVIVSSADLDFGTRGVLAANNDQSSAIQVQCTQSTPYDIGLSAGGGGSVAARVMTGGPSGQTVSYGLFRDAARTQTWGITTGVDTVSATGNGAAQTFSVYGRVPAQPTPPPGNYADTITVTVTY